MKNEYFESVKDQNLNPPSSEYVYCSNYPWCRNRITQDKASDNDGLCDGCLEEQEEEPEFFQPIIDKIDELKGKGVL